MQNCDTTINADHAPSATLYESLLTASSKLLKWLQDVPPLVALQLHLPHALVNTQKHGKPGSVKEGEETQRLHGAHTSHAPCIYVSFREHPHICERKVHLIGRGR